MGHFENGRRQSLVKKIASAVSVAEEESMEEESPLINRSSRSTGAAGSIEFSPSSQERRSGENVTNNNRDDASGD